MTSEFHKICTYAAKIGGRILRDMLGKVGVREKGRADLVTDADFAAQKAIRGIVLGAFPGHLFLGEESDANERSEAASSFDFRWIVDPLDGTTNFVHGVPLFASSVALARGKDVLCGTVYNPMIDECFTAAKDEGAFLNDMPIRVSDVSEISAALASVSFPTTTLGDSPDLVAFLKLVPEAQAIRRTGSTAINLAYLAAGRFDLMTCYGANAWDVAAGVLLVREAGGVVTAPDGGPFDIDNGASLAASTATLHKKTVQLINTPAQ